MTTSDLQRQLSLVEAQLFASTALAVIDALDVSADVDEAAIRLQALGMTRDEAATVLEMPLRARTKAERDVLLREAERLRLALE